MVRFTTQDLEQVMRLPDQVRNFAVIAHVDHGKSTLTDSLFAGAGAIRMDQAGNRRVTDDRKDEEARCITIKSTGVSLLFPESDEIPHKTVLNVIDSPGHVDFSSEVTAALRATDGALVIVDCAEGVCVQTETVLRQALQEMIQPVLVLNKMDRFFLELQYDAEEIYQRLCRVIESVNVIIATYQNELMGDMTLDPCKGNVAFAAGLMGWGFTLPQMARFYSKRQAGASPRKITNRLWGEHYVDRQGKWHSSPVEGGVRGFCELVIKPIQTVFQSCMANPIAWAPLDQLLPKLPAHLNEEQRSTMAPKAMIKSILQQWIPAHLCLLDMAVSHLPSPKQSQRYRVEGLYEGPMDDEVAESIRNCDPDGPLIIYISKMAPERPDDRTSRFLAFGRVFSGTIKPGQMVSVYNANYEFGNLKDCIQNVAVNRVCAMIPKPTSVSRVSAGNIVSLFGLDSYITKTATLSNLVPIHPIKNMTFSVAAVVQRAVEPRKASDLPKLVAAIKQLNSGDSLVQCFQNSSGEYVIAGAGELHLEICLNDLQIYMGDAKLEVRDPVVNYRETIVGESATFLTKSPNRHNRLFISAQPLQEELVEDILRDRIQVRSKKATQLARTLARDYQWTFEDAKSVWGFYPFDGDSTNSFVNASRGVQYVNETKDSIEAALNWVTQHGPLIEGEMHGVQFRLTDAVLHADTIHRSGGQIIPAARQGFIAAYLAAQPRIVEPVYLVEITCPRLAINGCYQVLGKRRAIIIGEEARQTSELVALTAYMPVAESFGFSQDLRAATSGQAFPQMVFDHWELVPGDPLEEGSLAHQVVQQVRARRGMREQLPLPEEYAAATTAE